MEMVSQVHSANRTNQEQQNTPAALRRREINRLLWDFYGDFPLSMTEWQEVKIAPKKPRAERRPKAGRNSAPNCGMPPVS